MRLRARGLTLCLLAGAVLIAACDTMPGGGMIAGAGVGGGSGSSIVYGSVTSAATGPVVASLVVLAEDSSCAGTIFGQSVGTSSTDGAFRIVVTSSSAGAGCVVVRAVEAGNPDTAVVETSNVAFGAKDSTRVSVLFP